MNFKEEGILLIVVEEQLRIQCRVGGRARLHEHIQMALQNVSATQSTQPMICCESSRSSH